MKKIILEKWKIVNLVLVFISAVVIGSVTLFAYKGYCGSLCSSDLIWSMLSPVYNIAKVFIFICIGLLFIPVHIFKSWLFILFPVFCLVMYLRLSTISVNEYGGILQWSRSGMGEFGTIIFAVITIIFVIGHLIYDKWKSKLAK